MTDKHDKPAMTDKATPTPSPASVDSVMALAEVHSLAAFHDGRNNDNRRSQKHIDAYDALHAEAERLAAQAAPTEPPQEFESAQGRALASAWAEGWAQCRDAEYVGEEAESEAFNQSATLAQCLHADQTRFQGGLSNDELRRAWSAKLPNVIPTDEQLTAFALGIEAAAQPSQAPVVQAVQVGPERTPQDYAIEHAEYMAVNGESLLAAIEALSAAELKQEETGEDDDGAVADARDDVWSATRALRSGIYEFRKRRDRASSGAAQAVRMLTRDELNDVALSEKVGWGPGEYVEAVQRKFCAINKGKRIPADGVIGGAT